MPSSSGFNDLGETRDIIEGIRFDSNYNIRGVSDEWGYFYTHLGSPLQDNEVVAVLNELCVQKNNSVFKDSGVAEQMRDLCYQWCNSLRGSQSQAYVIAELNRIQAVLMALLKLEEDRARAEARGVGDGGE